MFLYLLIQTSPELAWFKNAYISLSYLFCKLIIPTLQVKFSQFVSAHQENRHDRCIYFLFPSRQSFYPKASRRVTCRQSRRVSRLELHPCRIRLGRRDQGRHRKDRHSSIFAQPGMDQIQRMPQGNDPRHSAWQTSYPYFVPHARSGTGSSAGIGENQLGIHAGYGQF